MARLTSLQDLFVKELHDIYDAERQISLALPRMREATSSPPIRSAFDEHHRQTLEQIARLEQVFDSVDTRARGTRCQGMAGIIEEGETLLEEKADAPVRDAALIAAAQRAEHYEIAAYGTLTTYARRLGHDIAADLLEQTLQEEKETDRKLTELAEGIANPSAEDAGEATRRGATRH